MHQAACKGMLGSDTTVLEDGTLIMLNPNMQNLKKIMAAFFKFSDHHCVAGYIRDLPPPMPTATSSMEESSKYAAYQASRKAAYDSLMERAANMAVHLFTYTGTQRYGSNAKMVGVFAKEWKQAKEGHVALPHRLELAMSSWSRSTFKAMIMQALSSASRGPCDTMSTVTMQCMASGDVDGVPYLDGISHEPH